MPRAREIILLNFEFKNEATRAACNFQVNKRKLKWWPFWNKVYTFSYFSEWREVLISESYGYIQHCSLFLFTGQEWAEWGVTQLQLATIDFNNAPSQEMLWQGVGFIEKMD